MNRQLQPSVVSLTHGTLHLWGPGDTGRPVLVFVHGAYHGAWCFEHYVRYFAADGLACAAVDLRGHGKLPQDDLFVRSGQREMAEDVVEAVQALGREAVLVGHSAGGGVVAAAATRIRCAGMILLAPAPPGQLQGLSKLPEVDASGPVPPPDKETVHRRFFPNHSRAASDALWEKLVPESPALLNDRRSLRVHIDRTRISGPAMLISAGRDDLSLHGPGQDYETARFYDAEYHFVTDAGHCFMVEPDWQREAALMLRWLTKQFGPGRGRS